MKNLLLLPLLLISQILFSQVTNRNMLGNAYTLQDVQYSLVSKNAWKPYPQTPAEWKAAVPDSVRKKLIQVGEEALDYKFEPISATISLDFVRSGDRRRHSGISFTKRNRLVELDSC